jgi:glucose/arabinose dehydrogenase
MATVPRSRSWPQRAADARCAGVFALLTALAGCGERATLPESAGVGASPELPPPNETLIPTVRIAPAIGWRAAQTPTAAAGLQVAAFARDLEHPRWLYVLPDGDVLVAESNAPAKEDPPSGPRAWVMQRAMKKAGAAVPSPDRITRLRDADGDGVAEERSVFRAGLHSPFGMVLVGETLYVANADALLAFDYRPGDTELRGAARTVAALPGGPINHHWTKNVIATPDGGTLLVTVGSNSNIGENGLENETNRAAILAIDARSGATRVFASGLRNPNGMDWEPSSHVLWTVVNERDELGSDLVPDYLTSVREGEHFGWPHSYWGRHVDSRVEPPRPDLVQRSRAPDFALGTHVAPLGLTFDRGSSLPAPYRDGAFVGLHGSWNRDPPAGYEVVFVAFRAGQPRDRRITVLDGFRDAQGNARGRPVGVVIARDGALLVADDVGNSVWRVSGAAR